MIVKLSFVLIAIFLSANSIQSQNFDKYVEKAEDAYKTGDYNKALKLNEKLKKKVVKKLGPENNYIALYHINKAKYNLGRGILNDFESDINKGIEISEKINEGDKLHHVLNLINVADIYILYENYLKAEDHLSKAESTLGNIGKLDDNFKASIALRKAKILSGQGFYNKALEFIEDNEAYLMGRAVEKETYVDPDNGKLKTRKLSREETDQRFTEYATLLVVKANTLRKQGEVFKADAAFEFAKDWIKKNLGKDASLTAQAYHLHGKWWEDVGNKTGEAEKSYERALIYARKDHVESHYQIQEIYMSLLSNYLYEGKNQAYNAIRKDYENSIGRYFSKNSMYYINLYTLEFDVRLDNEKTKNIENTAASILTDSKVLPEYHPKRIDLLEFLYKVAISEQNYLNGENYLKEILKIKENLYGQKSPQYHLSRIKLAHHYVDYTNKIKEAEEIYNTSFHGVVEKEISSLHSEYIDILNHLAEFYESNDEYDLASETLGKNLTAARQKYDNEDVEYGVELEKIASLQLRIGEYQKAGENIKTALEILGEEKKDKYDVIHYVNALETKAKLNAIQGMFDEAEYYLNRSQRFKKRAVSTARYDELGATEELAGLYIALGQYSDTEELLEEIIERKKEIYGDNSRNLIGPLTDYGRLKLIQGDYTEAEKIARNVTNIAEKTFGPNSTKLAQPLKLHADLYTILGDYEKAENTIKRAIAIEEKQFGRDHIDVAKSISTLALVKFYKGDDPVEIEKLFEDARNAIVNKLGDRNPEYAEILKDLAVLYIATKKYDKAFNALGLAETIWVNKVGHRNNIKAAGIYVLTGDIHYEQRVFEKAEEEYEKAKKLYEKFFNENHPEYVKVLSKLSRVYYMEGDSKKAKKNIDEALANYNIFIKEYFPALSEREKAKFWNTIRGDFEYFNTLALELKEEFPEMIEDMYNNALNTKALLLNSSIKVRERILSSNDLELISLYNEWVNKKEILTNALSMGPEQLEENELDPDAITAEVEALEKQLSEKSQLFSSTFDDKRITWEDVRLALRPNEVAVELVRFRYFDHVFTDSVIYAGLYVKNDGTQDKPGIFLMKNGKDMESKYFKFYRNSINFQIEDRYSYDVYWKPIRDHVGATSTIYLSSDGVFNQINLEAIPSGDGKYVIDNSHIILVSNTKDIYLNKVQTQKIQEENRASIFGNPDFYVSANSTRRSNIGQLPGTEKEIEELKEVLVNQGWEIKDYIKSEASEARIKNLRNPKVFHIATHGFFRPSEEFEEKLGQSEAQAVQNPLLRTGLLLKGAGDLLDKTTYNYNMDEGILTAYEAMNLNLDQTDLVVLSACETGLGDLKYGEGVYGLQRAFMVAGARTLIMSMFKVPDEATQKLMVKFYKKWLETGNKRESFVEAKKELRNEYQDPKFWGAFIMIGLD